MTERLLEIIALRKSFGGLVAVNNLDLHLNRGEILGLIGPNGSGKTTLFNLVAGVYRPDQGEILLEGKPITHAPSHEISRLGIARTFQIPMPFQRLSVLENVLVARFFGSSPAVGRARAVRESEDILSFINLSGKRRVIAGSLGVLDRKRLELGRALAVRPKIILLDEIMGGLNPAEVGTAMGLVKSIRDSGVTVIFVEHVMKAVMGISDRVVVLRSGGKLFEGKAADAACDPGVVECYLGGGRRAQG